jgi:phospho-N-acetylmuramoyl-pentapeptide-transferase
MAKNAFPVLYFRSFLFSIKDRLTTSLDLPFTDFSLELGLFYWVFAILFIVYVVNAVNLTDGIDGLASSVTFVVFVFFGCMAYLAKMEDMTFLSVAVCGGMIGFLLYNYYPARIFMGDTGSLFLGGAVIGGAFWLNKPLIVVIVGFIYIWEALSVMLQVFSFKLTGKRIFKMAPYHHHLEMCKWKEKDIVSAFSIVTALLCVAAYFMFY